MLAFEKMLTFSGNAPSWGVDISVYQKGTCKRPIVGLYEYKFTN